MAFLGDIDASNQAAQAEENAANNAAQVQQNMFNTTNSEYAPYRQAGTQALGQLQSELPQLTSQFNLNDFYNNDPGYQFQLKQGQQALQQSAAARGLLNSTGTMKDMDSYSQGLANQDYNQALQNYMAQNQQTYGMLSGIVNQGMGAAGGTASAGQAAASNLGNIYTQAGNAQAAADVAPFNTLSQLGSQAAMLYSL